LKKYLIHTLAVGPSLIIYSLICKQLNFIQDDAYISYRYVENFLNGHGLVYNIGERIEGYTNFGWVILMSLFGALGIDYIPVSRILGWLCGGGTIVLCYMIGRLLFEGRYRWFAVVPPYLVAINYSLSYWSQSGLETGAFALAVVASLHLFMTRNYLLIATLIFAVWLRPEGAFVAGLLIGIELLLERRVPRFSLYCVLAAFVFSLPYVVFKIMYYGSILPNPFYAKTGFKLSHLANGLEYVWRFFTHYGFYGFGIVLPLLFYKKLNKSILTVGLFFAVYTVYILLVGGDVLKVHRFFLPLFGLSALLVVYSLWLLLVYVDAKLRYFILILISAPLIYFTYDLPHKFVMQFNWNEKGFTHKMMTLARNMKESYSDDFSVALPTIGIFGYELVGHEIIDMVGLTDSTIARHSEPEVPGMLSTWKERKHNSRYLLEKGPDFIVFSTGPKPSAPAERALILYPQFYNSYSLTGWYYFDPTFSPVGVTISAWHKEHPVEGEVVPTYSVEWVETIKQGLDAYGKRNFQRSINFLSRAIRMEPTANHSIMLMHIGSCYMQQNKAHLGAKALNLLLEKDSVVFGAHRDLFLYESVIGNPEKAQVHRRWLERLSPWYVARLDTLVVRQKARQQPR
jgi:hypothetical protein